MRSLTVWCHPVPPPPNLTNVILWGAFLPDGAPDDWVSLPIEVGIRRHELRHRYSKWVHEVGMRPRHGRSLRETITMRPGFSYWWMTTPASNALASDSPVYRAVRFMALDQIAEDRGATHIEIYGSDKAVAATIKSWARKHKRTVQWHRRTAPHKSGAASHKSRPFKEKMVGFFPPLGALSVLLRLARATNSSKQVQEAGESAQLLLVDYLAHLSQPALDGERFESNYWGPLVDVVEKQPPVTWLHLSPSRPSNSSLNREQALMHSWRSRPGIQHDLLHAGLTRAIKWRAARDYLSIVVKGLRLTGKKSLYREETSGISLWNTFKREFRDEWYGPTAMINALYVNLFDDYLANAPRVRTGIYLFEGQPWEAAFIHAWRRHGHGRLIGFAHSTILFWDMRIFQNHRDLASTENVDARSWPDLLAITGSRMRNMLLDGGYSSECLVDVEAIRFLSHPPRVDSLKPDETRILLLGDYSWDSTERMLDVVRPVLAEAQSTRRVMLRLHPACHPRWQHLPKWFELDTKNSAAAALAESDVVICGPLTSAAVDSSARNLPTLLVADPHVLPGSPAEQMGAIYVYSSSDLARALDSLPSSSDHAPTTPDAEETPRRTSLDGWQSLLNLPQSAFGSPP